MVLDLLTFHLSPFIIVPIISFYNCFDFFFGLIVCIESSTYCQAHVKQKWLCCIVCCLLAGCHYCFRSFCSDGQSNVYVLSNEVQSFFFFRGVPSRLCEILHYYLFLSSEELCCSLVRSHVQVQRGFF